MIEFSQRSFSAKVRRELETPPGRPAQTPQPHIAVCLAELDVTLIGDIAADDRHIPVTLSRPVGYPRI
jgi:hypothetical protein